MLRVFQELGELTTKYWTSLGGQVEAFPEAATAAFTESKVLETVEVDDIVDWFANSSALPEQYGKDFGQPPINVYVTDKFYIQVLFWIDGTTAIHEHAFLGAFGVLAGSSVHSQYTFEMQNALAPELRLGNVNFVGSELLRKGDVRTIHNGGDFIHALFHLDRPSVSVVVRTPFLPQTIQYSYIKPHVAFDPFFEDMNTKIKLRLLESLRSARAAGFWRYAHSLLDQAGPWMAFKVLMQAFQASREFKEQWGELLDSATRKYGLQVTGQYVASIKDDERSKKLARLRSYVGDRDYRFFLALLLNVPVRGTLLNLISHEFKTEEPETLVAQWIRKMSDAGMFVTRFEPALLETIELAAQHGSFPKAREAVLKQMPQESPLADEEQMKKLWGAAQAIPFFSPLFEASFQTAA